MDRITPAEYDAAMAVDLSRTVRFCLMPDGSLATDAPVSNSFAAWPPMRGLGRYYELTVTCRGVPDERTGYFMNIKRIDAAARELALPIIADCAGVADRASQLGELLAAVIVRLNAALDDSVIDVALRLTPTLAIAMEQSDMSQVRIAQQYDFAAAHRLHVPTMSDADNVATFGKCNNPAGHGHNYRLEVTVLTPVDADGAAPHVEQLDAIVNANTIEHLDHKNLDVDVPQFADMNTSVENIARVIYEMLGPAIADAGLKLDEIKVWETAKTVCSYRG